MIFDQLLPEERGNCLVDACVSSKSRKAGPFWATHGTESGNEDGKRLATQVVAREIMFSSAGGTKGEAGNSFCSGGDLVRRPPNLARRCPFPAVTHPTRRGLPDSTGSTLDGMSLL